MSPPVFSPGIGDQVLARAREGWVACYVAAVPVDGRPTYTVRVHSTGDELTRSIFDLKPAVDVEEDTDEFPSKATQPTIPSLLRPKCYTTDDVENLNEHRRSLCAQLLTSLVGSDFDADTPLRMARALRDLTDGYDTTDLERLLKTFPVDSDPGIVVVRDVPFASVCEHHVLPFTGTASVAYLPSDRIVGLSKIPRLVRAVSRRLQVQERIGIQVADAMERHVGARGVLVVLRGRHSCMALRGAESSGEMVTSAARGVLLDNSAARAEALSLMDQGR